MERQRGFVKALQQLPDFQEYSLVRIPPYMPTGLLACWNAPCPLTCYAGYECNVLCDCLQVCRGHPMVHRSDLTDLLIAPMQHQCHYQLLLEVCNTVSAIWLVFRHMIHAECSEGDL